MTTLVEAHSLSSLAQVFANPPQYPRNPTHAAYEPLSLYIVRVPGSQDVFLTPLKPPTKASITVDAIKSSLYYFHVVTPEDEAFRKSFENEAPGGTGPPTTKIPRKPVPSSISKDEIVEGSADDGTTAAERDDQVRNLGVFQGVSSPERIPTIHRKPVGPRPLVSQTTSPGVQQMDGRHIASSERNQDEWSQRLESMKVSNSPRSSTDGNPPILPPRPSESAQIDNEDVELIHVTIIRRDPGTGAQWNVGSFTRRRHGVGPALDSVDIEVATIGYRKFARQLNVQSFDRSQIEQIMGSAKSPNSGQAAPSLAASPTSPSVASPSQPSPLMFVRNIFLPKHMTSRSNHGRHRSNSLDSHPLQHSPQPPLTFLSPWQGTCTFTTGLDGRSLKCRHKLPSTNPEHTEQAVLAADLRFNLPWAAALRKKDINRSTARGTAALSSFGGDAKSTFKKGVVRIRHELNSPGAHSPSHTPHYQFREGDAENPSKAKIEAEGTDDSESESGSPPPTLDLSLGREDAGGGLKGRDAKLGKIVLRDEGLKMADLVVAACMGIWWGVRDGLMGE